MRRMGSSGRRLASRRQAPGTAKEGARTTGRPGAAKMFPRGRQEGLRRRSRH